MLDVWLLSACVFLVILCIILSLPLIFLYRYYRKYWRLENDKIEIVIRNDEEAILAAIQMNGDLFKCPQCSLINKQALEKCLILRKFLDIMSDDDNAEKNDDEEKSKQDENNNQAQVRPSPAKPKPKREKVPPPIQFTTVPLRQPNLKEAIQNSIKNMKKSEATLDLNKFINTILADSNLTFLVSADPMPISFISAVHPAMGQKVFVTSAANTLYNGSVGGCSGTVANFSTSTKLSAIHAPAQHLKKTFKAMVESMRQKLTNTGYTPSTTAVIPPPCLTPIMRPRRGSNVSQHVVIDLQNIEVCDSSFEEESSSDLDGFTFHPGANNKNKVVATSQIVDLSPRVKIVLCPSTSSSIKHQTKISTAGNTTVNLTPTLQNGSTITSDSSNFLNVIDRVRSLRKLPATYCDSIAPLNTRNPEKPENVSIANLQHSDSKKSRTSINEIIPL